MIGSRVRDEGRSLPRGLLTHTGSQEGRRSSGDSWAASARKAWQGLHQLLRGEKKEGETEGEMGTERRNRRVGNRKTGSPGGREGGGQWDRRAGRGNLERQPEQSSSGLDMGAPGPGQPCQSPPKAARRSTHRPLLPVPSRSTRSLPGQAHMCPLTPPHTQRLTHTHTLSITSQHTQLHKCPLPCLAACTRGQHNPGALRLLGGQERPRNSGSHLEPCSPCCVCPGP